jgi:uncharacterized protein with HEPN domain
MNMLYHERRFYDIINVYNRMSSYKPESDEYLFERAELLLDALVEKVLI